MQIEDVDMSHLFINIVIKHFILVDKFVYIITKPQNTGHPGSQSKELLFFSLAANVIRSEMWQIYCQNTLLHNDQVWLHEMCPMPGSIIMVVLCYNGLNL